MTNGKEFALVLSRFCEDRHLTSREFSRHIGRPYSTVRRWMSGKAPRESVVRDVCVKIGVDSEAVLGRRSAEPMAEFDQTLRFFQARYRHWIKTDPMKAHEILGLAGVVAYHRTLQLGLRARFMITSTPEMILISPDDNPQKLSLQVFGNELRVNLGVRQLKETERPLLLSEPLNATTLQNVVNRLRQSGAEPTTHKESIKTGNASGESVGGDGQVKIGVEIDAFLDGLWAEAAESGLTLAFLQARYQHWIKTDPTKAQEILSLAGVVAYHRTLQLGLRACFMITSTPHVIIIGPDDTFSPDNPQKLALGVLGNDQCVTIGFMSLGGERQTCLPFGPLNDASLQNVVEKIQSDQPPPILD